MLMQMIDCMIDQDLSLSARRTTDMRRYIVSRWNRMHGESIDEDAVALFLCDESRGALTEEQRIFAKECREEIKACYRNTVFRMFQCGEMMRRHLVSGPEEYCRIFLPQHDVAPCGRRIPLCDGLWAAVCPACGRGGTLCPSPAGSGRLRGTNGAPGEAQRSGFAGERRSSVMSEFSPFGAEMRDMELATTRSRRKNRRCGAAGSLTTARSAGSYGS